MTLVLLGPQKVFEGLYIPFPIIRPNVSSSSQRETARRIISHGQLKSNIGTEQKQKKKNKITLKEIAKKSQQAISPLHFHTHPSHSIPQASLRDQSCVFIFYLFFLKKPGHRLLWEQVTCVLNRADAQQCLYTWQPWTAVSNSCYFDGHVMALRHNGC